MVWCRNGLRWCDVEDRHQDDNDDKDSGEGDDEEEEENDDGARLKDCNRVNKNSNARIFLRLMDALLKGLPRER